MAGLVPGRAGTHFQHMISNKGEGVKMSTFKGIIGAAAIAALGVMGTGCDDDEIVPVDDVEFDAIDTSGDGLVSATEWNAAFNAWDVNRDAYIAPNEYLLDDGFNTLDVDRNALLTATEWNSAMTAWDLDADGFLDADEMFF